MLFLCLSLFCCFGCVLPVEESQTNSFDDSSAAPLESVANASDGIDASDASALLYDGEGLKIYYAYRQGQPGVCVEAVSWGETHRRFQELPYTQGMTDLVFTGVETKSKEDRKTEYVYLRYLDNTGSERILCADQMSPNYTVVYPMSTESGLELTEEFNDMLLIGYLYEHIYAEKDRLSDPNKWESICQRRILDALYLNYGDALPPYLKGEETTQNQITVIMQEELEAFFQSTVGRPCLVPDRRHMPYDEPWEDLLPGQVPMPETDYYCVGNVRQAVMEPDGTVCLYGYISRYGLCDDAVCHIRPADGYLGGCVESTDVFHVFYADNDPAVTLAPSITIISNPSASACSTEKEDINFSVSGFRVHSFERCRDRNIENGAAISTAP